MSSDSTATNRPTVRSCIEQLSRARIFELGREHELLLDAGKNRAQLAGEIEHSGRVSFRKMLADLTRDELRRICRAHELPAKERSRPKLVGALLQAHGSLESTPPPPLFGAPVARNLPAAGDTVRMRHREWLVTEVNLGDTQEELTHVKAVCLDDDNRGRSAECLWEVELGARVTSAADTDSLAFDGVDDPDAFAAYLRALRWYSVSATDRNLFQSPFRSGIRVYPYQLVPLKKALDLPRTNLFIADDVGLGKTIEAGLVAQELALRQRVDFVVVVCPSPVARQWQDEMFRRFGMRFEIYDREFVARTRKNRGFGTNPWASHNRFIISYPLLRKSDYHAPLLGFLRRDGERMRRSLLIMDEAHSAAPASAARYATDTDTTNAVRSVAACFENRLFLSATPHNGHSNSFSALLELLDPQRFTRGIPVQDPTRLEPVMVRRLKKDLRGAGLGESFPQREVVRIPIRHRSDGFSVELASGEVQLGESPELELARALEAYATAVPKEMRRKAEHLRRVNLQKRLLSSIPAFLRTAAKGKLLQQAAMADEVEEADQTDLVEGEAEELSFAEVAAELREAVDKAQHYRDRPDAKFMALLAWIRESIAPGAGLSGTTLEPDKNKSVNARRVIIFTEYADTLRYLKELLHAAFAEVEGGTRNIACIYGGMNDDKRRDVQRAFNSPPEDNALRVLLATDAAREGLNLQAHCADLIHYDLPWNPSRLEQRNGRIDRTLQPADVVRCHYLVYEDRPADRVLEALIEKAQVISEELGSLGDVVAEKIGASLEQEGISEESLALADKVAPEAFAEEAVKTELEAQRTGEGRIAEVREEVDKVGDIFDVSKKALGFNADELRRVVDHGLRVSGFEPLESIEEGLFRVPEIGDPSWRETMDTLRVPLEELENVSLGTDAASIHDRPLLPVVFDAPKRMRADRIHLHLSHPFVERLLSRFLSQGYGAHDLHRLVAVRSDASSLRTVVAIGRLVLYAENAGRLHDELIFSAARIRGSELQPLGADTVKEVVSATNEALLVPNQVGAQALLEVRERAAADFASLWSHVKTEADAKAKDAEVKLRQRGNEESEELERLLKAQEKDLRDRLSGQMSLSFSPDDIPARERKQLDLDRRYQEDRIGWIQREIETEPEALRELYKVRLHRLEPVGLIYLYPEGSA